MGLPPSEFWELTYSEFDKIVERYKEKKKNQLDELIYLAWHIAALERQKELPKLESLLNNKHKSDMTDEEMLAMGKMIAAAYGGETVEREIN